MRTKVSSHSLYGLNNPYKYTDPSGNTALIVTLEMGNLLATILGITFATLMATYALQSILGMIAEYSAIGLLPVDPVTPEMMTGPGTSGGGAEDPAPSITPQSTPLGYSPQFGNNPSAEDIGKSIEGKTGTFTQSSGNSRYSDHAKSDMAKRGVTKSKVESIINNNRGFPLKSDPNKIGHYDSKSQTLVLKVKDTVISVMKPATHTYVNRIKL